MSINVTRRSILKTGAATAVTAPWIVPSTVFGQNAPSNAILAAGIGVGRMGKWDIENLLHQGVERNVRVVATCDVDSKRAEACAKRLKEVYKKHADKDQPVKAYTDYREVIARDDVDVVT
ncbi:MAG: Gfo/Idh/MocA family oxidoreductase, partial [Rhodospirillales bacterium]|nr:Gfo/Idh/MocA family oxidoreductase [Rhodospirillales bacterium]